MKVNGKYGFIDQSGQIVVAVEKKFSSSIRYFDLLKKEISPIPIKRQKLHILNNEGIDLSQYKNLNYFTNHLSVFANGDNHGVISSEGELINWTLAEYPTVEYDQEYLEVSAFIKTKVLLSKKITRAYKSGLVHESRGAITQPIFEKIRNIDHQMGRAEVEKNEKFAFVSLKDGQMLTDYYDRIYEARQDSSFKVRDNRRYGLVNLNCGLSIPTQYDRIYDADRHGISKTRQGSNYGFIHYRKGKLLPAKYEKINDFQCGLAVVVDRNRYGLIDTNGVFKIPLSSRYQRMYSCSEERIRVRENGKWGYLDTNGNEIIAPQYEDASDFLDGLAKVKLNKKYGFVNMTGEFMIDAKYDYIGDFSKKGTAKVSTGGKYGLIDQVGTAVLKPKYDEILEFEEGIARIKIAKKYGLINDLGQIIVPHFFDLISSLKDGKFKVEINNIYFIINREGKCIANCPDEDILNEYGIAKASDDPQK